MFQFGNHDTRLFSWWCNVTPEKYVAALEESRGRTSKRVKKGMYDIPLLRVLLRQLLFAVQSRSRFGADSVLQHRSVW